MILQKQIVPIFPIPIYYSNLNRKFTKKENNFFKKIISKNVNNFGNIVSSNNYVFNNKVLKTIKEEINIRLEDYLNKILQPKNNIDLYITQSWINSTTKNQYHHAHAHPNSLISGVLYLDADPKIDRIYFIKDSNPRVSLKTKNYNMFNSTSWFFSVKPGDLLIFPSSTNHYVAQKKENNKRISLSFNTFVKGKLGDNTSLNELFL